MAPILLIEDDLSLQRSLRDFFEDAGYRTLASGTRQEGEQLLQSHGRDKAICLLDLNLPDGSGLDLLRQIVRDHLPLKVVVMSAFPIQHLRGRFPPSVLVAMITKPFAPQQLLDVIDRIARNGAAV